MLTKLKLWLTGLGTALMLGLVVFGRVMKIQRDKARLERDRARASLEAKRKTESLLKEREKEIYSRSREIAKEIEESGKSNNLANPNDWD